MDKNICFLNSNDGSGLLAFGGGEIRSLKRTGAIDAMSEFITKNKGLYVFLCLSYDLKNEIENLSSNNVDLLEIRRTPSTPQIARLDTGELQ